MRAARTRARGAARTGILAMATPPPGGPSRRPDSYEALGDGFGAGGGGGDFPPPGPPRRGHSTKKLGGGGGASAGSRRRERFAAGIGGTTKSASSASTATGIARGRMVTRVPSDANSESTSTTLGETLSVGSSSNNNNSNGNMNIDLQHRRHHQMNSGSGNGNSANCYLPPRCGGATSSSTCCSRSTSGPVDVDEARPVHEAWSTSDRQLYFGGACGSVGGGGGGSRAGTRSSCGPVDVDECRPTGPVDVVGNSSSALGVGLRGLSLGGGSGSVDVDTSSCVYSRGSRGSSGPVDVDTGCGVSDCVGGGGGCGSSTVRSGPVDVDEGCRPSAAGAVADDVDWSGIGAADCSSDEEDDDETFPFGFDDLLFVVDDDYCERELVGYEVGFEPEVVTEVSSESPTSASCFYEARRKFSEELIPEPIREDGVNGGSGRNARDAAAAASAAGGGGKPRAISRREGRSASSGVDYMASADRHPPRHHRRVRSAGGGRTSATC